MENLWHKREALFAKKEGLQKEIAELEKQIRHLDHLLDEVEEPKTVSLKKDDQLDLLRSHLKEAYQAHLTMERRRFFIPLFVRHPKVVIAESIALAANAAKPLLGKYPHLNPLFEEIMGEADKKWNKELFEGKAKALYLRFEEVINRELHRVQDLGAVLLEEES